jgi:hypothetical protein
MIEIRKDLPLNPIQLRHASFLVVANTEAKVQQFLCTIESLLQALQQTNEAEAKTCKEVVEEIKRRDFHFTLSIYTNNLQP